MKSVSVGVFEAKNRLSALIGDVEAGAEVTITSRGRPVARLVGVNAVSAERQAEARGAAERIRARARTIAGRFDWEEWRTYRDEGRP